MLQYTYKSMCVFTISFNEVHAQVSAYCTAWLTRGVNVNVAHIESSLLIGLKFGRQAVRVSYPF